LWYHTDRFFGTQAAEKSLDELKGLRGTTEAQISSGNKHSIILMLCNEYILTMI
jgi:hypothetical protein